MLGAVIMRRRPTEEQEGKEVIYIESDTVRTLKNKYLEVKNMGKTELHVLLRMELTLHSCIYSPRQRSRAAEWQARFGKSAECGLTGDVDLVGPGARVVRS
jgi:hypothetical protein